MFVYIVTSTEIHDYTTEIERVFYSKDGAESYVENVPDILKGGYSYSIIKFNVE